MILSKSERNIFVGNAFSRGKLMKVKTDDLEIDETCDNTPSPTDCYS